jgi:hypothetical protein
MEIINQIKRIFSRKNQVLFNTGYLTYGDLQIGSQPFGRTIFASCVEALTDLANDVAFVLEAGNKEKFTHFNSLFKEYGEFILNKIYSDGFVILGYNRDLGFRILTTEEYQISTINNKVIARSTIQDVEVYAMQSQTYSSFGISDYGFCAPYVKYLDNILNASNTATERLGVMAIVTPRNGSQSPLPAVLTKDQKKEIEDEMQNEYGALRKQNTLMVLPREMNVSTLSLANIDIKVQEKVKLAILAIAGKIKIPANQVPLIDAMSSKSLSNGGELKEGDFSKYQSFERLLNKTFIRLAEDMHIRVNYTIYNKPIRKENV